MTEPLQPRRSNVARRTRVLLALEDGEYRLSSLAAWADLSSQQARADLKWLQNRGLVAAAVSFGRVGYSPDSASDGVQRPHWTITDAGREYLAGAGAREEAW